MDDLRVALAVVGALGVALALVALALGVALGVVALSLGSGWLGAAVVALASVEARRRLARKGD